MYDWEIRPGVICKVRYPRSDREESKRYRIIGWASGIYRQYVEVRSDDGKRFFFRPDELLPIDRDKTK